MTATPDIDTWDIQFLASTTQAIRGSETGQRLFSLIKEELPEAFPSHIDTKEPITQKFSAAALEKCWGSDYVLWKRAGAKKAVGQAIASRGFQRQSYCSLRLATGYGQIRIASVAEAACNILVPFHALLHSGNPKEYSNFSDKNLASKSHSPHKNCDIYLSAYKLVHGLPELFWMNYLGKPYVEMIDVDKFKWPHKKITSDGGMFVYLTDDIADACTYSERMLAAREELKRNPQFGPLCANFEERRPAEKIPPIIDYLTPIRQIVPFWGMPKNIKST
jgi:hypothetical protein